MSKEITIAQFFQGVQLPDSSGLYGGDGERLTYDLSGERFVNSAGAYGYRAHFTGAYICYTCGHLCECGEVSE